jgi:Esterase-like activity of phytase
MLCHISWLRIFTLAVMLCGASLSLTRAQSDSLRIDEASVTATYTLPDTPLAAWQDTVLPEHPIADDRGMLLGGIGSDLWHGPDDAPDEFWMLTDRGPNGQIEDDDSKRRTFPVPDFTPLILHARVAGNNIEILEALPLLNQYGDPVTGLPNLDDGDKKPWDLTGEVRLDFNQDGLDPEGLVRTTRGDFWLADEYRPSLVKVDATGRVVVRFVPEGVDLPDAHYPVADTLPAIYAERDDNHGFEGLALSGDERTLYALLQSPLATSDDENVKRSRNGRILAVDTASGRPVAEYVYRLEPVNEFDPSFKVKDQEEMNLSGLVWLSQTQLLVLERTDQMSRLYLVDLAGATNILGEKWDEFHHHDSLEEERDLDDVGVTPVGKTRWIDLDRLRGMPDKIEGLSVVDDATIAVANDNDFNIAAFTDPSQPTVKSQLLIIKTPLRP